MMFRTFVNGNSYNSLADSAFSGEPCELRFRCGFFGDDEVDADDLLACDVVASDMYSSSKIELSIKFWGKFFVAN